jgi:hypothetical protein
MQFVNYSYKQNPLLSLGEGGWGDEVNFFMFFILLSNGDKI